VTEQSPHVLIPDGWEHATASSHWSHGSAEYPSYAKRTLRSSTASLNRPVTYPFKELTVRLRRGRCELCEEPGKVQVHQVRKLAQLEPAGADQPMWKAVMARKRRKTLVVCHP
jgi:hypothetical protein